MSREWWTIVYFPRARSWSEQLVDAVLDRFFHQGCRFLRRNDSVGSFWSLDGMENLDTADLSLVLRMLREQRGGAIQLWYPAEDMEFLLTFDPCSALHASIYPDRDFPYGTVRFSVDYTYLHSTSPETIQARYRLILTWSQILAQTVQPFYGWGDLFDYDVLWAVHPTALANRVIPRLSWWNYFSRDYVDALGTDMLLTSAPWALFSDQDGMTMIMSAPGEPARATQSDLRAILGHPE